MKRLEFIKTRFLEIINSDVDFTRFGWVSEVSNQNNYNGFRTKMIKWLHMYAPSFLDWCYVYDRDRHHEYDGINKAL